MLNSLAHVARQRMVCVAARKTDPEVEVPEPLLCGVPGLAQAHEALAANGFPRELVVLANPSAGFLAGPYVAGVLEAELRAESETAELCGLVESAVRTR